MLISQASTDFFHCEHKSDRDFSSVNKGLLHSHFDLLEITYIIHGNTDYMIENTIYPVVNGDIFIFRPDEMHCIWREYGGAYDRINLYLPESFFTHCRCESFFDYIYKRGLSNNNVVNVNCTPYDLKGQFRRLDEYMKSKDTEPAVMHSVLTELLYMLIKSEGASYHREYKNEYIGDIILYIHINLQRKLRLDMIADHLHINKQYMCKVFKKHTGITINDYIISKRLQNAVKLYSENGSLLDSALEAGFANYSTFYKALQNKYGCTPSVLLNSKTDQSY